MGARKHPGTTGTGKTKQDTGKWGKLTRYERYMFNTITPIHG